ncbi:hypothetical protein PMI21_05753 [Pseudomonas sp. GM18]|nr:hypothetical protein PMI21_05753 [Pseudomonas sp. GM18]
MINASLLQRVIDASSDGIVIAEKEDEQDATNGSNQSAN